MVPPTVLVMRWVTAISTVSIILTVFRRTIVGRVGAPVAPVPVDVGVVIILWIRLVV
jgi:hypothetical protein